MHLMLSFRDTTSEVDRKNTSDKFAVLTAAMNTEANDVDLDIITDLS